MKMRDIAEGVEYAVGHPDYPRKAVAVQVGNFTRRVYSGARWDFQGHPYTGPACKVRYDDGKEEVVALTQVLRPWREQQVLNDQKELRRKRQRRLAARSRRVEQDLQRALMGQRTTGVQRVTIHLNHETAKELVELLAEQGFDGQNANFYAPDPPEVADDHD